MKKVRIGGVPEHFNMPWHLALQNNLFINQNIDLEWIDYPTGTGAMCKDLAENKLDLALLLTEGAVADFERNHQFQFVQWYVKSPLTWGIHTAYSNDNINSLTDIENKKYAISRFGSGSHLMASVNASQLNYNVKESDFLVVNNLKGAIESLSKGEAELFLWEKYTTKPYVDDKIFKRIGECPNPWPCFILVAHNNFIEKESETLQKVVKIINETTQQLTKDEALINKIATKYQLQKSDVTEWIKSVEWHSENTYDQEILNNVKITLQKLGIL